VEKLLLHAQSIGFTGIAQSSWGPTGCVFTESKQKAEDLVSQLNLFIKSNFTPSQSPNILICQANNTGALISNSPTRFIN
jgi:predicted sugar kinase